MMQKLLLLFISFFSSLNQNKFSNSAKWFCLTFLMFQMGYGQTCNVVTNSTFTGNANGWTLGGTGVGWYYESTWAPNEIYIEKDGATDQSLKQSVTGLINNSLTLSFKIKGQNANRLSTCPTTATLVIKLGGITYMTINNVAGSVGSPNTQITTANVSTTNGATYTQSGFPLTVGGATSGITITQGTITLTIPWNPAIATTADLEFVATTSNTANGSCLAWGGDDWFLDDIMLYTNNPTAYNMSGTSVCAGTATTVGLLNSQLGVNYQLYRNGSTAVGSPVAGTGAAVSFGSQTVTGVYTSVATAGTTGCITPMNGSVSINPNPTLTNATQPAAQPAVCAGSAATINLTGLLPSTTSTINYTINGVTQTAITGVVSDASGAGSFTTPVLTIANNGQILQITAITNTSATPNCTSSFTRNVTLAVNATPTLTGASQPVAACVGSGATINLTGLLASATSTISYSINGVAQTAVTGVVSDASGAASFSTVALTAANNGQQLRITGVSTTSTTPSCSATFSQNLILSVNPAPTLTGAAQSAAICAGSGALINLTGLPANSTSTINYTINSIAQTAITGVVANSAGSASFTTAALTAANNGQQLQITGVTVTSSTPNCSGTFAQNVTLAVNPVLTASVSISTSPAGTVCAGTNVTFTATPTNPGTTPVYQWKLNGVNVGTNSTTYTNSTLLLNNDVVTCEMTSNASPCLTGSPAISNAIIVASAGPATTGVTICTNGSGSLTSSMTCTVPGSSVRNAGTGTSVTGVGTSAWSSPSLITADDNSNATALRNSDGTTTTNYLQATNFGFAIPTNATITGVTVSVNRYASANSSSDYVRDNVVSLIKSGSVTSTNRGLTTTNWIITQSNVASYGGTNDLWSSSWTPAEINATNFGVALSANITRDNGTVTANVDYIQVTITYTVPGSIGWYTASSGGTLLGSGSSFNPVGVAGSSLTNTLTPGTTIFYAACSSSPNCRTPTAFVINAAPTITVISSPSPLCSGGSLNPSAPTVTNNGSAVTASGWEISTTSGGSTYTALSLPYTVAYADNGKNIRYYATNGCGRTDSNVVAITVNPLPGTPTVTAGTDPTCSSFLANWTAAPNATGYYLDVSTVNNFSTGPYSNLDIGLVSSYNVTGLNKETTYFYRLRAYNSCGTSISSNYDQIKTLDVAKATISGTTTVCKDAASPIITFSNSEDGPITVTYNINGGSNLTINVGAKTTATVTVPTGTSGTFTYRLVSAVYQSVTTCITSLTGSAIVTVNDYLTTPTVGTVTNISCTTNTGSVVLNDLPTTGGNWTITSTPAIASVTGSGNTTTISGLASGSYTFTVTNASGCPSPASALVTISDFSSTTWNGSGWSNGAPNATKNVIIASSSGSPFAADLEACALTINSGVVANVPAGVTLTVTNSVTTNGQLTFENNSSLVQINDVPNTGAIIYKRISQKMVNFDYTYWASPVVGQTLFNLSPNTLSDKYHSFTGTDWKTINKGAGVMLPGIGYIIRTPKAGVWPAPYPETVVFPYAQPVQFKGVPTNGTFRSSETMAAGNFYLVGNPYPCALDADEFLFLNTHNKDILGGTIYLWTHNSAIKASGSKYVYVSDDYASYNLTGGTATTAGAPSASTGGSNANAPSGYIAAGQSFFVSAEAPGNIEFTNLMRAGGPNNAQFFKPGRTSKSRLEKHRLWLNMTNSGGAYKQTLIGYIQGATNTYDKSFDGISFDGNSYVDFYSINESNNYVIQGRALPFNDGDIVPLGYRSTVAGDFTIAIDHADGNLATQRVYLEDKQTGLVNELTAGNYTFNTKAGTFNNRFVLKYTNRTLGTGDLETVDSSIFVVAQNKTITVSSENDNLEKVFIYDVAGKQLYAKENVNNLQLIMQNLPFAQQVLLVKIFLENGKTTTRKVVFK